MPITRRSLFPAGLLLLGAPSVGLSILTRSSRALAGSDDELRRFFNSSYTYCDANVLGKLWGQSVGEAKARIGRKIGWRDEAVIEAMLVEGRKVAMPRARDVCPYYENGYAYDDMEQLMKLWQDKDISHTKLRAAQKLVNGDHKLLADDVRAARRAGQVDRYSVPEQAEDLRRFDKSGFTYCDAKVLAGYWTVSPMDAKLRIGNKIGKKKRKAVEKNLHSARKVATRKAEDFCPYYESGYAYSDMTSLADYWGVSLEKTKTQAAIKLVNGRGKLLASEVKEARRPIKHAPIRKPPVKPSR